jgi:hypothetical protein
MSCDFQQLKEDTHWLLYAIAAIALVTVIMDVQYWRKAEPCVKPAHTKSSTEVCH